MDSREGGGDIRGHPMRREGAGGAMIFGVFILVLAIAVIWSAVDAFGLWGLILGPIVVVMTAAWLAFLFFVLAFLFGAGKDIKPEWWFWSIVLGPGPIALFLLTLKVGVFLTDRRS
jgi:hypothetical protein